MTIAAKAGAVLIWLLAFAAHAAPATDFSYQGLLRDNGVPANGSYDFQFLLFDAATNGSQVGSTATVGNLNVSNGLFVATLDFGATAFKGVARWLEIRVRPGASTGSYSTMSPRTPIEGAPTALYANTTDDVGAGLLKADRTTPLLIVNNTPLEYRNGSNALRAKVFTYATGEGAIQVFGPNGFLNAEMSAVGMQPNSGFMAVADAAGNYQAGAFVNNGVGTIFGDTKAFIVDHPDQPGKKIVYISLEGPESAIYCRGVGKLVDGRATIEMPEHFRALANLRTLTVQLTPATLRSQGLGYEVAEDGKVVVGELNEGKGSYEFSYLVHAVRKGREGHLPVQDAAKALPEGLNGLKAGSGLGAAAEGAAAATSTAAPRAAYSVD